MVTFIICLGLLVAAYFGYGRYLERVCEVKDSAEVPSKTLDDGVDYLPMPLWKTFMIQLLNIAGVGPIFGAIMGACFGPVAFIWITLGGIFIGAMHDYISGIIITRNDGVSLPEIVGRYLGGGLRDFMRVMSLVLLILVGVVFMRSPASILSEMAPAIPYWWWVGIILIYYFIATMLPMWACCITPSPERRVSRRIMAAHGATRTETTTFRTESGIRSAWSSRWISPANCMSMAHTLRTCPWRLTSRRSIRCSSAPAVLATPAMPSTSRPTTTIPSS